MSSSDFGGKPYPSWKNGNFSFPGYKNAVMELTNVKNKSVVKHGFLVSPSGFSDQRSNNAQANKTTAGWVIYRTGKALGTIALSGITLDTKEVPERLTFIKRISKYIDDGYNDRFETKNDWLQAIVIEGVRYKGYIQNISFSKNGQTPYVYQYSITFLVYSDEVIHHSNSKESLTESVMDVLSGAKVGNSKTTSYTAPTAKLSSNLYDILTRANK